MNWFDKLFKKTEKGDHKKLTDLILILGLGILLLFISNNFFRPSFSNHLNNVQQTTTPITEEKLQNQESFEIQLEKKLIQSLSKIEGVGKVDVMITLEAGKEIVLNKDTPFTESTTREEDGEGGSRNISNRDVEEKTIMKNVGNGSTEPIIMMEREPIIKGIIIIAEGGNDPYIKSQLMKAGEVLLGIPSHKVQIFKMK
ncbi:MAG: hypothetical protein GX238_03285 [Epulopiscium sp.]|nr:hypothetical protein [Candidatus Epulonipiscium sp.]